MHGEFEAWSSLADTLTPLLRDQVGRLFLPWSIANANAIENGHDEFSVNLDDSTWTQKPQKYHARSLAAIRSKYTAVQDHAQLNSVLNDTGCLQYLAA